MLAGRPCWTGTGSTGPGRGAGRPILTASSIRARTLLPVAGQPDQLMLQALCAGEVSWRQLEEIKKAGAREMFVLPVEKMLA